MAREENFWGGSIVVWMIYNPLMMNRNTETDLLSNPICNGKPLWNWSSMVHPLRISESEPANLVEVCKRSVQENNSLPRRSLRDPFI